MPFQANVDQPLLIDGIAYRVAEHPAAPGMPYGQEGRQGTVYQLAAETGQRALKVFKPRYRAPALVGQAARIASLAHLPGLTVCRRTVLRPREHASLLRLHPDLIYAVLMPWAEGPTWMEIVLEKRPYTGEQSLALARAFAHILAEMEERGLAHCDLSGPNVIVTGLEQGGNGCEIELVDVEQMYGPELQRPDVLPGGSPGYAHRTAPEGMWGIGADRFSGALILSEMLGWCVPEVREASWGESYFEPAEPQHDGERYRTLRSVLGARWGAHIADLLERAWNSEVLADCPTLGEWVIALPESVPTPEVRSTPSGDRAAETETASAVQALLALARQFDAQGNLESALEAYRQAQTLAPEKSDRAGEIALIVEGLETRLQKARHLPPTAVRSGRDLEALFDAGLAAYRQREWASAAELFSAVLAQDTDYSRGGRCASDLRLRSERRAHRPRRKRWLAWVAIPLVLAALIACGTILAGGGLFARRALVLLGTRSTPVAQPTVTRTPPSTRPTPTREPPTATQTATRAPTPTVTTTPTRMSSPTATFTPSRTAVPTPTASATPTSAPTPAPTPTDSPSWTHAAIGEFLPVNLGPVANWPLDHLVNRPSGEMWLAGVPFVLPREDPAIVQTQLHLLKDLPTLVPIWVTARSPRSVYVLLNGSHVASELANQQVGSITLVFSDGRTLITPVVVLTNLQDEVVSETDPPKMVGPPPPGTGWENVWSERQVRGGEPALGVIGMITIPIPASHSDATLVRIELLDSSVSNEGRLYPSLKLLAITVEVSPAR